MFVVLFWFRVYIVIFNDLGCFISLYIMYIFLVVGWLVFMFLYEFIIIDFIDFVYNLIWR